MPPAAIKSRRATLSKCRGRIPAHGSRVAYLKHPHKPQPAAHSNKVKPPHVSSSSAGSYASTSATILLNSAGHLVQIKLLAHAHTS